MCQCCALPPPILDDSLQQYTFCTHLQKPIETHYFWSHHTCVWVLLCMPSPKFSLVSLHLILGVPFSTCVGRIDCRGHTGLFPPHKTKEGNENCVNLRGGYNWHLRRVLRRNILLYGLDYDLHPFTGGAHCCIFAIYLVASSVEQGALVPSIVRDHV